MYQHPRNVSIKIQKDISSRAVNIPKFVIFHQGSMPTTRLTDIQTNLNYFDPVYQHLRKVSKKFQKDISFRTGDIPLSYFSKEVSKQTDWQTYMKFRIICSKCTNIPGISPEKIRKISHPELEISLYLSNFSKEVSQLTDWQTYKNP